MHWDFPLCPPVYIPWPWVDAVFPTLNLALGTRSGHPFLHALGSLATFWITRSLLEHVLQQVRADGETLLCSHPVPTLGSLLQCSHSDRHPPHPHLCCFAFLWVPRSVYLCFRQMPYRFFLQGLRLQKSIGKGWSRIGTSPHTDFISPKPSGSWRKQKHW